MPNVELAGKVRLSTFRRVALGTWRTAYDPSIYGSVTIRMDEAMRYLEAFREATGRRLTVTHMIAKVVGAVLEEMPETNSVLRWGRLYHRKETGVFFQVAITDEKTGEVDLSGLKIRQPQRKSLVEIIDEFEAKVAAVRSRKDNALERSRSMMRWVPPLLMYNLLRFLSFVSYTLNLDLRWAGVARDPFGSAMVTNVGSLGLEGAYAPLVPFSRVPLLIAMGELREEALVDDGEVVVGKVMRLFATFDHRVVDGAHGGAMVRIVRAWLEQPFEHFGPVPQPAQAAESQSAQDA